MLVFYWSHTDEAAHALKGLRNASWDVEEEVRTLNTPNPETLNPKTLKTLERPLSHFLACQRGGAC